MVLHGAAPLHTARVIVSAFNAPISDHGNNPLPHRYLQASIAFAHIQYVWVFISSNVLYAPQVAIGLLDYTGKSCTETEEQVLSSAKTIALLTLCLPILEQRQLAISSHQATELLSRCRVS